MDISSFTQLPKLDNALYVFDIDDTTLYYNFKLNDHVYKDIEEFEAATGEQTPDFRRANAILEEAFRTHTPVAHDRTGMEELKRFCDRNNGKIIFLTARFKTIEQLTVLHMQSLYSWISPNDVHLCDGTEKGVVLFDIVSSSDHRSIIFVDDKDYNIDSVKKYVPRASIYKMQIIGKLSSV